MEERRDVQGSKSISDQMAGRGICHNVGNVMVPDGSSVGQA